MRRHIDLIITCQTIAYAKLISIGKFFQQSHQNKRQDSNLNPALFFGRKIL